METASDTRRESLLFSHQHGKKVLIPIERSELAFRGNKVEQLTRSRFKVALEPSQHTLVTHLRQQMAREKVDEHCFVK